MLDLYMHGIYTHARLMTLTLMQRHSGLAEETIQCCTTVLNLIFGLFFFNFAYLQNKTMKWNNLTKEDCTFLLLSNQHYFLPKWASSSTGQLVEHCIARGEKLTYMYSASTNCCGTSKALMPVFSTAYQSGSWPPVYQLRWPSPDLLPTKWWSRDSAREVGFRQPRTFHCMSPCITYATVFCFPWLLVQTLKRFIWLGHGVFCILQCPTGNFPMGNSSRFLQGKPAATVILLNLKCY